MSFVAVCLGPRQKRPSKKHDKTNTINSVTKTRIARTYYLNLFSSVENTPYLPNFIAAMLRKVLKFANYAVAVLV